VRALGLLLLHVVAVWPVAHDAYLGIRHTSEKGAELLVVLACAALLLAWARSGSPRPGRSLAGPAVGLVACAALAATGPPLVAAVLAAANFTWTASLLLTTRRFHGGLFGLALLALPILPVFRLHLELPLRHLAARGAAALLRGSGADVRAVGTLLESGDLLVGVDPACAGVSMLWTGLLVALCAACLWDLGNVRTLVAAVLAVALVAAANTLRAAALFLVETSAVELPGWSHPAVGLVVQLGAVVSLLLLMRRWAPVRCSTPAST
jgi:exosortase/archaeosortase family protein